MTSGLPSALPRHRSCVTVSGAYVCACGHKLSLTAALSLTPTPPAAPTVSARYRSAVNPMPPLAIPSRRCRSASFLPPIARMPYCQPRSSHPQRKKPPTFQAPGTFLSSIVCDADTTPLQGREDLSPPADGNAGIIDPTRSTEIAVFTNTPSVSRLRPKHRQPRAFLAEAPLLCASAKNRCGLRVDRLFPPPPFRFLHATSALLRWHGATFRLHSQTIFGDYIPAFPDTAPTSRGRAASIPSPTRNLRLLFRAVDAMPLLSILRSARAANLRAPPTHRGSCHCHSVRRLPFIYRLRRYAHPRPRCAVRRCTDSTSAVGQPLHSLRVCLRLRARAGRLTVCGASSSTESLSLRTSATPAVCANPM